MRRSEYQTMTEDKQAQNQYSTRTGSETQWAAETKRRPVTTILSLYEKIELFWVLLVLADLVAQACKTANSSPSMLNLLST